MLVARHVPLDARGRRAGARRLLIALGAGVLVVLGAAAPACAEFGIVPGSFAADVFTADNTFDTQAGSHVFQATTSFAFNQTPIVGGTAPDENVRTIELGLPAGFTGNPEAASKCSRDNFNLINTALARCPATSQVGVAELTLQVVGSFQDTILVPVYNVVPQPGEVADFGIPVLQATVHLVPRLRAESDNGLTVRVSNVSEAAGVVMQKVTLWGVPADSRHDSERVCLAGFGNPDQICSASPYSLGVEPRAFLTNPTSCEGPQTSTLRVDSWQHPNDWTTSTYTTSSGVDRCDRLPFDPTIAARPSEDRADAPTGLGVKLSFPQDGLVDPSSLATAHLKRAAVTLPEGMTISPAGAGGLQACSDGDLKLKLGDPVTCPDAAKVGTVTATTPLLDEPLTGGIYIRSQNSSDPQSGEMFRIALVLESKERGISVRLPGSIRADKSTGQLVTTFDDNPQLPISTIDLQFKGGPRAPLATPPTCGPKTIDAQLTSWSGQTVDRHSTFTIACGPMLGGFTPAFTAGTANAVGGAFSPFSVSISKPDGNADLTGLTMRLPAGLTAKISGSLGTQVGSATAYAGPGSSPFALPGKVFLEGAYGDAPFSLRAVVPAVAGPFDLGTVMVRQKLYVDPDDAHVTVVSDPLPTIVSGVPVRLQRLDVSVDKPGFMINPTSCAPKTISATLGAADGQTAQASSRFQVGDCASLALKPSLALSLSGKDQTTDGKHPAVTATLTQKPGQANLKRVRVALPLSLALDPDNANGLCEFADGSKVEPTCPKASIVGTATAATPILDQPLSGPVYFVKNIRKDPKSGREIRTLPKLVIPLVGQNGVKLTLTGTSDVVDDQLVTTFDNIPDAPVSSFKLSIIGGKGGILVVSGADICKATQVADQQIDGQNNKDTDADVYIQTPSCPLKVLSTKVGKTSVAIKVGGLGAGKVTVTGRGIKKTTKTITKSTVATITAKRTKGTPGKFKVSFLPKGIKKAKTASATLR